MAYIDIQNVTYTYPLTKTPSIADVNLSFLICHHNSNHRSLVLEYK